MASQSGICQASSLLQCAALSLPHRCASAIDTATCFFSSWYRLRQNHLKASLLSSSLVGCASGSEKLSPLLVSAAPLCCRGCAAVAAASLLLLLLLRCVCVSRIAALPRLLCEGLSSQLKCRCDRQDKNRTREREPKCRLAILISGSAQQLVCSCCPNVGLCVTLPKHKVCSNCRSLGSGWI